MSFSQKEAVCFFTRALSGIGNQERVVLQPGLDDCGIVRVEGELCLAITTDYTNFSPWGAQFGGVSLADRGHLLVTHNVSDVLSCGAQPLLFVGAIGLPRDWEARQIEELASGIREAALETGVAVLGGDTKEAPTLTLCGCACGLVRENELWRRSGAKVGDDLYVSGPVGGVAFSAWYLYSDRFPSLSNTATSSRRTLERVSLPLRLTSELRNLRLPLGAIDISDGLGADLTELLDRSAVGTAIQADAIPVPSWVMRECLELGVNPLEFAFGMGGDGQLTFSAPIGARKAIKKAGGFRIGSITEQKQGRFIAFGNREIELPSFGHTDFDHQSSVERLDSLVGKRFA